jgi:hypothetical protein
MLIYQLLPPYGYTNFEVMFDAIFGFFNFIELTIVETKETTKGSI